MTTIQVQTANTGKFRRRMSTYRLISSTLIPDVSERMSHDCIHTNNYTYIHTYIDIIIELIIVLLHCMRSVIYLQYHRSYKTFAIFNIDMLDGDLLLCTIYLTLPVRIVVGCLCGQLVRVLAVPHVNLLHWWYDASISSNQIIAYHSIKSYHSMKDVKYGIYIITRQVSSIIVQRDCRSSTYWRSSTYLRSSSTYLRRRSTYLRRSSTYSLTYPVGWVVGSTKARRVRNAECAHVQSYPAYLNMRSYVDTERLMCILIIGT
jgi:hypothetical protein